MTRLRDQFTTRQDYRAGELAPAEEVQPQPTGIDWFVITVWSALFGLSGLAWWGIWEAAKAVWNVIEGLF